jgi:ABC-2 type transport system ATP-binding protein
MRVPASGKEAIVADRVMIKAEGLVKRFGATTALDGIDLAVSAGFTLGLLGPNGAGKTTAVRVLTTLTRPDAGRAAVAGFDVVRQAGQVRRMIGVTAQDATLDELLTGRQNLAMVGELTGMGRRAARRRADELLDRFGLTAAAGRVLRTYSGGMRRRLDVAAGLMAEPPVLFLDEPTTGLDPASRLAVWNMVSELVAGGLAVLLTTQYLDEAERLCDRIMFIDQGRAVASGTAAELKAATGAATLHVTLTAPHPRARDALAPLVSGPVRESREGLGLTAPVSNRAGIASAVVRALDEAGAAVDDIEVRQPALDDVFLTLTAGGRRVPWGEGR